MEEDKIPLDNGSRDNEFKARWIDGTIEISLNKSYDCREKNARRPMCFKELLLIEKRERERERTYFLYSKYGSEFSLAE